MLLDELCAAKESEACILSGKREDMLYWQLAYYFTTKSGYHLIKTNENQSELWFENRRKTNARLIRLVRVDLDWSIRIKRETHVLSVQSVRLRKQMFFRNLSVLNLYVSPFAPVDDYEHLLETASHDNEKVKIETMIMTRENTEQALNSVGEMIEEPPLDFRENVDFAESEIFMMKETVLLKASHQAREERKIFEYSKPFFTYLFLAIQIIFYLFLEIKGGSTNTETLIKYGAKYNPLIIEGEWWRFISPIFIHIGMLHLIMNTLALYYLGSAVEKIYGRLRFLWIYLLSGFTGTLASFVLTENIAAGASGAIFGCFGALLYFGIVYPRIFFRTMGINVIVLVGINLIFGFTVPGIDNAGHIGGLIGGFFATGIFHFPRKRRILLQSSFLLILTAILSIMLYFGFHEERPEVMNSMIDKQIKNGEMSEAYNVISEYVSKGKGNAITYFQLSLLEIYRNDYYQAINHLHQAINLQPDFHEAHFN